jgi:hypothetical protein
MSYDYLFDNKGFSSLFSIFERSQKFNLSKLNNNNNAIEKGFELFSTAYK